jgi:large subunit ribosomal protein L6
MSRIGREPISVPAGTQVEIKDGIVSAKGPKGSMSQKILDGMSVSLEDGVLTVARSNDSGPQRSIHGLQRALISNAVSGVTTGFTKQLEVIGVGYRAEVQGEEVHFSLGYSHPVIFPIPQGISVEIDKQNRITVGGCDRQQVGQVAAEIRGLRRPDPYKGKGIKYSDEVIRRKVGKAGSK